MQGVPFGVKVVDGAIIWIKEISKMNYSSSKISLIPVILLNSLSAVNNGKSR